MVRAPASGYLQYIRHRDLVQFAADAGAVIALEYRPGHFLVRGHPFAAVWPPEAAGRRPHRRVARGSPAAEPTITVIPARNSPQRTVRATPRPPRRGPCGPAPPPGHVAMLTIRERRRGHDGDMDQCRAFPAARGPEGRGGAS